MTLLDAGLPKDVIDLIAAGNVAEFATVSAAGVPIDTPILYFPSEGLRTIDCATGLAYPAKADRARRNPKVGLLIEGRRSEPVISIAGIAAIRDADLQANMNRYLAETAWAIPGGAPWADAQKAFWYWTRIIISVTPRRILWWDNPAAMDAPPRRWDAPADTIYPQSDPAPAGAPSSAPQWPQPPWVDQARAMLERKRPGYLSLIDEDGFPRPIRARSIEVTETGLKLDIPAGALWRKKGAASFTFEGLATFVGEAAAEGPVTHLRIDRALPRLPLMEDAREVIYPTPATFETLFARLKHEAGRRNQSIPTVPIELPPMTAGARLRKARLENLTKRSA